ncbi:MAG: DUF1858 domain-containing protein [Lutispora sp.]
MHKNPDVIEIMKSLGFESITNPGMLNTAGRFMTISKGAAIQNERDYTAAKDLEPAGYKV